MELFWQAAALTVVGVLLRMLLRDSRELGTLLSLTVCTLTAAAAVSLLSPVAEFLGELRQMGGMDREFLTILLKCTGIGMVGELAALLCTDAGESAMAKGVELLEHAALLLLSLPLMRRLVELLEEVLGRI